MNRLGVIVAAGRVITNTVTPIVLYAWVIGNPAYGRPDHDIPRMVVSVGVIATTVLSVGLQLLSPTPLRSGSSVS